MSLPPAVDILNPVRDKDSWRLGLSDMLSVNACSGWPSKNASDWCRSGCGREIMLNMSAKHGELSIYQLVRDTSCGPPDTPIKTSREVCDRHSYQSIGATSTIKLPGLPNMAMLSDRRLSMDSDYGLSSSASTIDPNESFYSDCSSCVSLLSDVDDDVFVQSLVMRTESLCDLDHTMPESDAHVLSFRNTESLSKDLRVVNDFQEMCDVCFLVGEDKVPVFGVKAILCARSRVLCSQILSQERLRRKRKQRKPRLGIFRFLRASLRKKSPRPGHPETLGPLTVDIPNCQPDIFKKLILFLHSGTITVDISNVIGMMATADVYGLDDLRLACYQFARRFINVEAVLPLLQSTPGHPESELTQRLVDEALEFVELRAESVLRLEEFLHLPKSTVLLVLSRGKLRVSEETKWDAVLRWSRRHCCDDVSDLRDILKSFTHCINLLQIPLCKLMMEVTPLCCDSSQMASHAVVGDAAFMDSLTSLDLVSGSVESQRKSSVSSATSLTARSTDSGYTSFRESRLL